MTKFDIISADSHTMEPGDLWLKYIEPKYKEKSPRVIRKDDTDVFYCEGVNLLPIGAVGAVNKKPEEIRREGRFDKDIRKGGWDPHERRKDMEADGVEAEVLYPTFAMRMFAVKDADFQRALFQAYNTWVKDYCSYYPDRLKALGMIPLNDIEVGIGEMKRCKELGLCGAMIAISASEDKDYGSKTFDPFWAAAQELDMPVSLHILTESKPPSQISWADGATVHVHIQRSLANMVFGGVFYRFPKLKVISAENDAGWAAHYLQHMDYIFVKRRNIRHMDIPFTTPPSEYFRRGVYLTFMRDLSVVPMREKVGVDNLMWASDYPHQDSTWPHSQEMIHKLFDGIPAAERRKMVAENAAKLYAFN